MDVKVIVNELLNIIAEKNNQKNSSERASQEYKTVYSYYDSIKSIKSFGELIVFRNKLLKDYNLTIDNYEKYYRVYSDLVQKKAPVSERNKYAIIINNYKYSAEAIDIFITIINKYTVKNKFTPKAENQEKVQPKAKPVTQTAPKTVTQMNSSNLVAVGYNHEFANNKYTVEYYRLSKIIKEDYMQLAGLEMGSKAAEQLQRKLYDDLQARRKFIKDYFGNSEVLSNVYRNLFYIESQERLLYKETPSTTITEENIDFRECMTRIKTYLTQISNMYFTENPDYKKISEITNKYNNLMTSINKVINSLDAKDLARDLLNLVSTFNVDGDYDKFRKHYKDKKIGTESVSNIMYKKAQTEIETKFKKLYNELNKKLGNKIVNVKSQEKSFKEKERDLFAYQYGIFNYILDFNKAKHL